MASADDNLPRFFKPFLTDHCSQNMRIPDAFQEHIMGPKRVIIKNRTGKMWPVEVAKIGDGLYFQGGWSRFVLDNSLSDGEFMVFKYNRHHMFEVLILGTHGCERELRVEEDEEGGRSQVDDEEEHRDEMEKEASKGLGKRNLSPEKSPRSNNLSSTMQKKHKEWIQHRLSLRRTT